MQRPPRPIIGVMGASACGPSIRELAFDVGARIAERGAILLCGGLSGVMEAAARGAKQRGGLTLGILPGRGPDDCPPNSYIDIPIYTGMGDARNVVNILSSDALIAVAGGPGTLSEVALALKAGKPLVLLRSWKLRPPEAGIPPDLHEARTAEEAVRVAFDLLD